MVLTLLHEVGHALGLNHTQEGVTQLDSVMAYDAPDLDGVDWWNADGKWVNPQTAMVDDIAALQSAYGADETTRADDIVYGFNADAGNDLYDFAVNINPVMTIYDAGGNDTLDLSGSDLNCFINLTSGSTSSFNGMTHNLAIAESTQIENVIGGGGNDIITGSANDETLAGGGGDDTFLDFKAGEDKVDLSAWGDLCFEDLTIEQNSAQTLIKFENDSLTFAQLDATSLSADDFAF